MGQRTHPRLLLGARLGLLEDLPLALDGDAWRTHRIGAERGGWALGRGAGRGAGARLRTALLRALQGVAARSGVGGALGERATA